ncbi:hypothetical protein ABIE44_003616 [Marmoricola sp. OAE513]|uniref:hypothetical protein n=1 Tax=Marmoricola sp. OAE513 TaxID=2817894 RepID=UPI001AE4DAEA
MDSALLGAILAALGGAVVALLAVGLLAVLRRRNRSRADLEAMLDAALRESDDLRTRLEELSVQLPDHPAAVPTESLTYLITDAGRPGADVAVPVEDPVVVPDRLVLSATVGTPLVKVAAFSHGVRRALSPENRNRIWFEMRREVRAARKRRKQLVKQYQRDLRADDRSQESLA